MMAGVSTRISLAAHRAGSWLGVDERGTAIIEFALILPMLMILYIGGFEASQSISIYRKISDLTTSLANISSRDTIYYKSVIDSENAASSQIMSPYPTSDLTVTMTELTMDKTTPGKAVVIANRRLSNGANTTTRLKNAVLTGLPNSLSAGTTYILIETSYNYTVKVGANLINPIPTLSDQLYILPRTGAVSPCPDCD